MALQPYGPDDPRTPSASYRAQTHAYQLIEAALAGSEHVRSMREVFLPKYPAEVMNEYQRRLESAPWRPEFVDCLRNIAGKPFSKPVRLQGQVSPAITKFAEDVDTLGNNLHVFSSNSFWNGVAFGLHGILVEYPTMQPGMTLADELRAGARPYWCHLPAQDILDLRVAMDGGKTVVSHVRFKTSDERPEGRFGSRTVQQVKILEPGYWELWEADSKDKMQKVGEGQIALPRVPLALFYTGRKGCVPHPRPPLLDLADMQMELYRALSREDEVLTFAGSPMLTANGMAAPEGNGEVEIGPKRVLYAPSNGTGPTNWDFVQPNPGNLQQLRVHIQSIVDDMRRLGLQPLLPKTGDLTATVGAIEAAKAHSTAEAWANGLQDALEQALVYTSEWLGEEPTAEVSVHTDFSIDLMGTAEMTEMLRARTEGQISRETYWAEGTRRGFFGPQFDPKLEVRKIAAEPPVQPKTLAPAAATPPLSRA